MKIESRPYSRNTFRTDVKDALFYGKAAVGSHRSAQDIVVSLHGTQQGERTFRLYLTPDEAAQLQAALGAALAYRIELLAQAHARCQSILRAKLEAETEAQRQQQNEEQA